MARRGTAGRGKANTQRLTGRCSLLGAAWRGEAGHGMANTPRFFGSAEVCQGSARRGMARLGMAQSSG